MYHDILARIKGKKYRKCYRDLSHAVEVVVELQDGDLTMNEIADQIRDTTGKERSSVLKALSRAVDDIWDYGDRDALQELYEFRLQEKPSPKELINRLAEYQVRAVEYQLRDDGEGGICLVAINPIAKSVYGKIPVNRLYLTMSQLIWFLNRTQASLNAVIELFHGVEPE